MPNVINLRGRPDRSLPAGAVYIGRAVSRGGWKLAGSRWANTFSVKQLGREAAIRSYREALMGGRLGFTVEDVRRELEGCDLACWCAPQACHGDVLLEIANSSG
jgi:Domain of unknown function (DUF4326)